MLEAKLTAHVALDKDRYVISACADDAPDIGAFISKHVSAGDAIYKVPKQVAREVLYTTVPVDWPNCLTA
ncbi:hypothetical protein [Microbulbifer epialgicus]|uniref:Uncharacterized protein n=1 Tax=Microbulbifer epialgicus TaxID=393907 RepID=A0ABV4NVG8_9GAMM